ncbi:MAG: heavy-metal-associated domain-containing protein [Clostridia bacterium]|nr:heavy-metal-associated domain-containing protein [Clostridia bacterium]
MIKTTVKIDDMMCGMCEAHISDTIRKAFPDAKKVSASRKTGEATFLTENGIDMQALKTAIEKTGYTFISCSSEPYKKRGLFG